jgi:hypothetical protein
MEEYADNWQKHKLTLKQVEPGEMPFINRSSDVSWNSRASALIRREPKVQ